jgi:hypothetical protein
VRTGNTTIKLNRWQVAELRRIAQRHGYIADRGLGVGEGSISQLIAAIAAGEIILLLLPDEQRGELARWLDGEEAMDWIVQDALRTLREAIREADERAARAEAEEE